MEEDIKPPEADSAPKPSLFPPALISILLGVPAFVAVLLVAVALLSTDAERALRPHLGLVNVALLLAGVPAVVIGYIALRFINGAGGRLGGARLAVGGMALGGVATLVFAVGIVAALVLETREKANRVGCQNNLRVIGQGVAIYHDGHQHYPQGTLPNADLPPERRFSWLAGIAPDLGKAEEAALTTHRSDTPRRSAPELDLGQAWDAEANRAAVNVSLPEFMCPSYPRRAPPGTPALTTYVGMAGLGPDVATLPLSDPRAGFFGYDRVLTRQELQHARGETHTIMAGETAFENGPWAAGGFPTLRPLVADQAPYIGPGRPLGGIHSTGLYVLFADGSTTFFRNEFEASKLEALVMIHGE